MFVGSTEYHPGEQWLLDAWHRERQAIRLYAFKDIQQWFAE